jgi:hypothetical protein
MKRFLLILGVLLSLLGVVGLAHPSFIYHKQEEVAKFGPIKATMDEEKTADIPVAASVVVLAAGLVFVLLGLRMQK